MKFLRLSVLWGVLFLCLGISGCAQTEKTEAITAEITAAQIEGRKAARDFLTSDLSDSVKIQHALLEAKARQSKYLIENKPQCASAFDSAFLSTIRVVNPSLRRAIHP